jgi:YaeQ protein
LRPQGGKGTGGFGSIPPAHWTPGRRAGTVAGLPAKYSIEFESDDRRRPLPHKLLLALGPNESARHAAFKLLAYVLFYRERLKVETEVPDDSIPFVPDLCELGYDLRPLLWIECGDCSAAKLRKVAAKCPESEIWCLKRSMPEADGLIRNMDREEMRPGRVGLVVFETAFFDEFTGLLRERNKLHWFRGGFAGEPGVEAHQLQMEFNGLWFDETFQVIRR